MPCVRQNDKFRSNFRRRPVLMKLKIYNVLLFMLIAVFFAIPAEAKLSHETAKNVWGRVAEATDLTKIPFTIKEEKTPNAWVTNGKSVTVTTGLLNILDSPAELYGVFAHEAGHAKLGHYDDTVKHATGLSVAAAVLGQLLGGGIGDTAVNVGANLAYAGWSREQEVEADDYAVRLAHKNGEDPVGLYSAMLKLSKSGSKLQPSGFNSHPPDDRRLLHIRNEILKLEPNAKFPDGSEKTSGLQTPVDPVAKTQTDQPKTATVGPRKSGGYDIDAAIERMKKEEAAKNKAAGSTN